MEEALTFTEQEFQQLIDEGRIGQGLPWDETRIIVGIDFVDHYIVVVTPIDI